jgi:hypothetical protein
MVPTSPYPKRMSLKAQIALKQGRLSWRPVSLESLASILRLFIRILERELGRLSTHLHDFLHLAGFVLYRQLPGDCSVRINADAARHHSAWWRCAFQWPVLDLRAAQFEFRRPFLKNENFSGNGCCGQQNTTGRRLLRAGSIQIGGAQSIVPFVAFQRPGPRSKL